MFEANIDSKQIRVQNLFVCFFFVSLIQKKEEMNEQMWIFLVIVVVASSADAKGSSAINSELNKNN